MDPALVAAPRYYGEVLPPCVRRTPVFALNLFATQLFVGPEGRGNHPLCGLPPSSFALPSFPGRSSSSGRIPRASKARPRWTASSLPCHGHAPWPGLRCGHRFADPWGYPPPPGPFGVGWFLRPGGCYLAPPSEIRRNFFQ